jgi:thiol-disulfide isomerase/thioredoxin
MRAAGPVLASLLALACLLGLASCRGAAEATPRPATDAGLDLTLRALDGKTLALSSLRGKVVLVDVWATWCGPCRRALPGLARLSQARPADLAVVGVLAGDDPANLRELLRAQPLPYFMAVEDHRTQRAFPIDALPTVYILDRKGRVVDRVVGAVPEAELLRRATAHL